MSIILPILILNTDVIIQFDLGRKSIKEYHDNL